MAQENHGTDDKQRRFVELQQELERVEQATEEVIQKKEHYLLQIFQFRQERDDAMRMLKREPHGNNETRPCIRAWKPSTEPGDF